ncbi:hypothetical protein HDE_08871 [Halotydeus destructor]|nr:hypothetical protein HDE_08871 [Halotydeus destructor]
MKKRTFFSFKKKDRLSEGVVLTGTIRTIADGPGETSVSGSASEPNVVHHSRHNSGDKSKAVLQPQRSLPVTYPVPVSDPSITRTAVELAHQVCSNPSPNAVTEATDNRLKKTKSVPVKPASTADSKLFFRNKSTTSTSSSSGGSKRSELDKSSSRNGSAMPLVKGKDKDKDKNEFDFRTSVGSKVCCFVSHVI